MLVDTGAPKDPPQALKAQRSRIFSVSEEEISLYPCQTLCLLVQGEPTAFSTTGQSAELRPPELTINIL